MTVQSPREESHVEDSHVTFTYRESTADRSIPAAAIVSTPPPKSLFEPLEMMTYVRDFAQTPLAGLIEQANPAAYASCVAEQANCRAYTEQYLWPNVERWDQIAARDHDFAPWPAIDGALKYGFLSMGLPTMFGGRGVGSLAWNVWTEEISAADAGMYVVFGSHGLALSALVGGQNLGVIGRIAIEIAEAEKKGKALMLALGYTEVGGGSDVEDSDEIQRGRITSRFTKVAGGYLVNARKVFISVGNLASYCVVTAYGDPKDPLHTTGGFLIRRDSPGFSIGRVEHKMGQRLCSAVEIICEDVFVPEDLGYLVGDGARNIDTVLSLTRGPVGTMATGVIRGCLERTLRYLAQKRKNGRWLFEEQWVQLALADMLASLQAARGLYMQSALSLERWGLPSLVPKTKIPKAIQNSEPFRQMMMHPNSTKRAKEGYAAAIAMGQLRRVVADASIAKFMCSDLAVSTSMKAMEILGEDANDPQWGVEKCMRDVKLAQIFEGTNQVNRLHVARGLLKRS